MARKSNPAFKVGDLVEAKSFQIGFRGAWFRCKIREITMRQGRDVHLLEYYDFPDDKLITLRLYQLAPHPWGKGRGKHTELMLRPQYPQIYNEKQRPPAPIELSQVTVIVDNPWKVGDLVDWWSDGCYWSGKITQLLIHDKAQIELKPPPLGEGSLYEVLYKDVRPSLDWSPEQGWTIPCQEGESGFPFARVMKPTNQGVGVASKSAFSDEAKSTRTKEEMIKKRSPEQEKEEEGRNSSPKLALKEGAAGIDGVASKSAFSDEAKSTRTKEEMIKKRSREQEKEEEGRNSSPKLALKEGAAGIDGVASKSAFSNEAKSSRTKEEMIKKRSPEEEKEEEGRNRYPDTMEGAIMELEEYLNKVKWLKKVLHSGGISSPEPPQWELVDQNPKS